MKRLWNWIDNKDFAYEGKIKVFLFLNCIIFGLLGFCIWMIVRNFTFDSVECAICFVGYSGFCIGYLGGYFFLCRQ